MTLLCLDNWRERKRRVSALCEAVEAAGGSVVKIGRSPSEWDQEAPGWRAAAAAVCGGVRPQDARARMALRRAGIPLVIVELGYLRRANQDGEPGYYQLSLGRIGRLPDVPCQPDRFHALDIELEFSAWWERRRILVLGQVPNDGQHQLRQADLWRWLRTRARGAARMIGGEAPLVWRPHPLCGQEFSTSYWPAVEHGGPEGVPLTEAIGLSRLVVTYNSTAGIEAVRLGVPMLCHPSAHYAEIACGWSRDERHQYFCRLAYAQWNLAELRDGRALEWLTRILPR